MNHELTVPAARRWMLLLVLSTVVCAVLAAITMTATKARAEEPTWGRGPLFLCDTQGQVEAMLKARGHTYSLAEASAEVNRMRTKKVCGVGIVAYIVQDTVSKVVVSARVYAVKRLRVVATPNKATGQWEADGEFLFGVFLEPGWHI